MRPAAGVTLILLLALGGSGCGQKGPLRLPAEPTANTSPAATPAAPAASGAQRPRP